jgi:hypothetical protein
MGHTIRGAKDSISGVRAMSTAPIHATRSRLRFPRPPPFLEPRLRGGCLPFGSPLFQGVSSATLPPSEREPDPPVEGPAAALRAFLRSFRSSPF